MVCSYGLAWSRGQLFFIPLVVVNAVARELRVTLEVAFLEERVLWASMPV